MHLQRSETKRGPRVSLRGCGLYRGTKEDQEEQRFTKKIKETKSSFVEISIFKIALKKEKEEESKEIEKVIALCMLFEYIIYLSI